MSNDIDKFEQKLIRQQNKKEFQRGLFLVSLTFIIIGFFFWFNPVFLTEIFVSYRQSESVGTFKIWGSFFILFSTVGFSYLYLSGFNIKKIQDDESTINKSTDDYLEVVSLLKSIDKSIEKGKLESVLSDKERHEIIDNMSETIKSQLNESLLSKIEETYGNTIYNDKLSIKADTLLNKTIERLILVEGELQSKANLNLVYGIASTIIAIFILIFVLINATIATDATTTTMVFYYTSRLLLVLTVQGISIFFLRLYKATLNDIMYINNELTNFEAKRDSLSLAFSTSQIDSATDMLTLLASTERNFTLKKGETSIFNKSKSTEDNSIDINILKEVLSKLKK